MYTKHDTVWQGRAAGYPACVTVTDGYATAWIWRRVGHAEDWEQAVDGAARIFAAWGLEREKQVRAAVATEREA